MTPTELRARVSIPVIAAPMLLVSGPDLVIATCSSGVIGSFPAANARTAEEYESWLVRIEAELSRIKDAAPYAVNIIVRGAGDERFDADLEITRRFKVPLVITSVGNPGETAKFIQSYGGLVFHDVATMRHAEKAIAAGVDGLILLTAGAGGHTGTANPFAFVRQVRAIWDGPIVLAGGISDGHAVRAAEILGADYAYMGTRFAATSESMASESYKALLVSQEMKDVITTDRISGLSATFMRGSIEAAGLDPDKLPPTKGPFQPDLPEGTKAWRDIWSAGHGVGGIDRILRASDLVHKVKFDYRLALAKEV